MKRLRLLLPVLFLLHSCARDEPPPAPTATVNAAVYSPGVPTQITVTNTSRFARIVNPKVTLAPWLDSIATSKNLTLSGYIAPNESHIFSFTVSNTALNVFISRQHIPSLTTNPTSGEIQVSADNLTSPVNPELDVNIPANPSSTATVNVPVYSPGVTAEITVTNTSAGALVVNPEVTLAPWLADIATSADLTLNGYIAPGESHTFRFTVSNTGPNVSTSRENYQSLITNPASGVIRVSADNLAASINPRLDVIIPRDPASLPLREDELVNADLWGNQPEILSAGYDFEGIAGVEEGQGNVVAAGGAWQSVATPNPPYSALTSAMTPSQVSAAWGYPMQFADAMSILFSWPVLPSSVDREDFAVTLNTGEIVTPYVASIAPSVEFNERSVVMILGEFGNRLAPGTPDAIYPTQVMIVDDLQLVGPSGPVNAAGLSKSSGNPFQVNGGPKLVAAKLSVMNDVGEGLGASAFPNGPNGGTALYGADAQYRLRVYSTAALSPDGIAAVLPTDFSKFFQIQVVDGGVPSLITQTNIPYIFSDGVITVVGLADLGANNSPLNDAYVADNDHYIDIILKGDEAAMRLITAVEVPAAGSYQPFYNPGGPGNDPAPGVVYTSPGPATSQPVTMAIDDPKTVNYP